MSNHAGSFRLQGMFCPAPGGQKLLPQGDHIREIQIVDFASAIVASFAVLSSPQPRLTTAALGWFSDNFVPPTQGHSAAWQPPANRNAASGCENFSLPLKSRSRFHRSGAPLFRPGKGSDTALCTASGIQRKNRLLHGVFLNLVFHKDSSLSYKGQLRACYSAFRQTNHAMLFRFPIHIRIHTFQPRLQAGNRLIGRCEKAAFS